MNAPSFSAHDLSREGSDFLCMRRGILAEDGLEGSNWAGTWFHTLFVTNVGVCGMKPRWEASWANLYLQS